MRNRSAGWRWAAAVVIAGIAAPAALAWNDRGHMLAAMIAYKELRPDVREQVNAILRKHPQYDLLTIGGPAAGPELDMYVFAKAATWPDLIRSNNNPLHEEESHPHWHYVDIPYSRDGTEGPNPEMAWNGRAEPTNLVQAMADVDGQVRARPTDPERRAIALCWVEHLVGDIHQPLHACSMFSSEYPRGDSGGNAFAVRRGDTPTSLHAYWDRALGNGTKLETLEKQVDGFCENPELTREKVMADRTASPDVAAWAKESRDLAEKFVYENGELKGVRHTGRGDYSASTPALPSGYEEMAKHLAAKQVVLAGYRMADTINAELGAPKLAPPRPTHRWFHMLKR